MKPTSQQQQSTAVVKRSQTSTAFDWSKLPKKSNGQKNLKKWGVHVQGGYLQWY
jgi:hypothetical protein